MSDTHALAVSPGQHDVDALLDLIVRDKRRPEPVGVTGELVAPAEERVDAFVLTLVASAQTQRTYARV